MYEITRLVEDSFLEEVTRSREQVESLKRRLKWSESRRRERDRDVIGRCVDCERKGLSNAEDDERSTSGQTEKSPKKERVPMEEINSCQGIAGATPSSDCKEALPLTKSSMKSIAVGSEKLDRLLKEETLRITPDSIELQERWGVNLDGSEESDLSGPSKHFSDQEIQHCQEDWAPGLDRRPEPGLDGESSDQCEPLYRNRYSMEDLGGFDKAGYEGGNMLDMSGLDGAQESPSHLGEELSYMGHYEGDLGACDRTENKSYQPGLSQNRKGAFNSTTGSPSRANIEVSGEFSCLLINEEGYLQDSSILYPEHMSGESGTGVSFQDEPSLDGVGDNGYSETYSHTPYVGERLQHQTGGRRHNCNQCSMSFADSASLKAHKQTHQAGQGPPYSCNQCGKTFTQACNLKVHQRIHSGQGLHLCSHCGKGFPSFSDLKTHKCSQTGDKPYSCTVCGNKFSRLWNLKLHRRIHTQEKPHRCAMCDKSFTRADILKVHQRTHTGERPYCCGICGLSFKRLDHLKSHQRKHRTDV
ncbi:zinc finger protein 329 isoform X2 [Lampris incognitus]|nr:zinc finger protein 329 isoform X2 [Lampris incognitus]